MSWDAREVSRHTTFRFCLDPTAEQRDVLARHAGAARFAFNQSLQLVKTALAQRKTDPDVNVPWTGFDLINSFNSWKRTEDAGRLFAVDAAGDVEIVVTGLPWRAEVCQQVFEEAAVDCGRAFKAWSDSRSTKRKGGRVGFPRFKRKGNAVASFRIRNRYPKNRGPVVRVGDNNRPRSVTLPGIGQMKVRDDTRRLRRMIAKDRAKILFATITYRADRWWIALNVQASDLHCAQVHSNRGMAESARWVGVDRGLSSFLVAATSDGYEVARIRNAPKALAAGLTRQRRLARSLSRKQKGSLNRREASAKLGRHHYYVANVRRHFLHQVSNALVKTHDQLVIEDLNVSGMLTNHRLARAISDAGWAEFARLLAYKQAWRGGSLLVADRWYPSSKLCSRCDGVRADLTLADRTFTCVCGYSADRDCNAAVNLARWAEAHPDSSNDPRTPKQLGRATNARRRDGADQHSLRAGETSPIEAGTEVHTALTV
jgi:putative transposase